jgi:hypothetical protein
MNGVAATVDICLCRGGSPMRAGRAAAALFLGMFVVGSLRAHGQRKSADQCRIDKLFHNIS